MNYYEERAEENKMSDRTRNAWIAGMITLQNSGNEAQITSTGSPVLADYSRAHNNRVS